MSKSGTITVISNKQKRLMRPDHSLPRSFVRSFCFFTSFWMNMNKCTIKQRICGMRMILQLHIFAQFIDVLIIQSIARRFNSAIRCSYSCLFVHSMEYIHTNICLMPMLGLVWFRFNGEMRTMPQS